jgi:flavorubredoxin
MKPFEIKKDLYWVGVIDWNLRDFHGYSTEKGSTYNAYLLLGEKNILFDTVKVEFTKTLIDNIKTIIDPSKIDYIVVNHAEMDHTGALPTIIDLVKPEKILCTKAGQDALIAHHHRNDWPFAIVKEGDTIQSGSRTVQFIGSAMIHWPDSMASYIKEDKILISNDIFGQHWATSERYADQIEPGELLHQATKYYANIFYPMSPAIRKFLEKLAKLNLEFDMLAPDHGLIWRKDIPAIIKQYGAWAGGEKKPKAVIVYDTMWGSTAAMAERVAKGLAGDNVSVTVYDLRFSHRSDIMTDILDAGAVIIGSSLLNGGILPKMEDFLSYMAGLRPTNKIGAAFGSFGWSDVIVRQLNEKLEAMKIKVVNPGVSVQYVPNSDILAKCEELGAIIRRELLSPSA